MLCDKDIGDCVCKIGWMGVKCMCEGEIWCVENLYCYDDDCLCIDGFLIKFFNCLGNVVICNYWKNKVFICMIFLLNIEILIISNKCIIFCLNNFKLISFKKI